MSLAASGEFVIRRASEADTSAVSAIENQVSPYPWNQRQFDDSLAEHNFLVLCRRQKPVGYLIYSQVLDQIELLNIAVKPSFQGEGLGAYLLDHLLETAKQQSCSVILEVRAGNFPAIGLYLGRGFVQQGERRDYYRGESGSEDALLLGLPHAQRA